MLVLSRQRDETIMIGDDIEITVVDIRGDKVRLGITAPTRIAVHRKEVYDAIKAENQRASAISGGDLAGVRPPVSPPARSKVGALSAGPLRVGPATGHHGGGPASPPAPPAARTG